MLDHQLASLLEPISAESPSGQALCYTSLYDDIRAARGPENLSDDLPQGVWETESKRSDWEKVSQLCIKALATQSKDLQLVAWLSEAFFFLGGMDRLNDGLKLMASMAQQFWDTIHPLYVNDDWGERFAPYEWLAYQLPESLLSVHISQPVLKSDPSYTLADWVDASHWDSASRKQKNPDDFLARTGRPALADIWESVSQTPLSFYATLEEQTNAVLSSLGTIDQTVSTLSHSDVSFFFRLKEQLKLLLSCLATLTPQALKVEKRLSLVMSNDDLPPTANDTGDVEEKSVFYEGPFRSREEAYDALSQVTRFFLKHDPHSPTSYVLEKILTWRDKSLPEVYAEFAKDPQALMFFMEFLGVKA